MNIRGDTENELDTQEKKVIFTHKRNIPILVRAGVLAATIIATINQLYASQLVVGQNLSPATVPLPTTNSALSSGNRDLEQISPCLEIPVAAPPYSIYLPFTRSDTSATLPPLPPPIPLYSPPPNDFAAIRAQLQQDGDELAFNKIGFHVGPVRVTNLDTDWWKPLDEACVPVFLKSVDSAEHLWEIQERMKVSGVPHTLVFRRSVPYNGAAPIGNPDVPDYNLDPATAAHNHWEWHKAGFPPELDPDYIWFETVNEVDKNRAEWLGQFALETAKITMAEGYRWAAFGWSSGEPEPYQWETPSMLEFLRLAGENPDKLAIALHEYSYDTDDIGRIYPYLIGRFQFLFDICDKYNIPRPTILITEWGWTYDNVPAPEKALTDIAWASWLYAAYPEVKGAAIWYLGPTEGDIAQKTQKLIAPIGQHSLGNYFAITPGHGGIDTSVFNP
jgi:hypothetical protein